ncbi:hypothetical protein ACEU59_21880 [Buttiauxella noackiae]|uniref:hypothetical protein n=1 Tax=Buttiauxella noackiae TaxID=82992 RepID=UPI0035A5A0E6
MLCNTGEACPKSGYWQIALLPHDGISQNAILAFNEGEMMPADKVTFYRQRIWPFSDTQHQEDQHVQWRFVGEV